MILKYNNFFEEFKNLLTLNLSFSMPGFIKNPQYLNKTIITSMTTILSLSSTSFFNDRTYKTKFFNNIYCNNYKINIIYLYNWFVRCNPLLFCNLFILIVCLD